MADRHSRREYIKAWKAAHWADLAAIKAVYREAAQLRRKTGEQWHVDHIVPLTHPLVCGLHVSWNLCVIQATQNQAKGNRLAVA